MLNKFRVKFRVNTFWLSPGEIIFNESNFELIFLWKRRLIIDYTQIISVKKSLYVLDKMLIVTTKKCNINLIAGFKFEQLMEQFKSLGFSIES